MLVTTVFKYSATVTSVPYWQYNAVLFDLIILRERVHAGFFKQQRQQLLYTINNIMQYEEIHCIILCSY